ncbi:MAG: hypothetical protein AB1668_03585 [Nanoarchaeota archaeon]
MLNHDTNYSLRKNCSYLRRTLPFLRRKSGSKRKGGKELALRQMVAACWRVFNLICCSISNTTSE